MKFIGFVIVLCYFASLPSRERGLKFYSGEMSEMQVGSLPSRERGLKFPDVKEKCHRIQSLPSRERGLKCRCEASNRLYQNVAPFAGAWIEIRVTVKHRQADGCRSLRGSVD